MARRRGPRAKSTLLHLLSLIHYLNLNLVVRSRLNLSLPNGKARHRPLQNFPLTSFPYELISGEAPCSRALRNPSEITGKTRRSTLHHQIDCLLGIKVQINIKALWPTAEIKLNLICLNSIIN